MIDRFALAKNELQKTCSYSPEDGCEEVFCILHHSEYLGKHDSKSHACLGCNLNTSLEFIYRFLKQNKSKKDIEYTFTNFTLLIFLLVEKLTTIFRVIGITQEYVEINWTVLVEMRKWANFVKHPKGFLFSHHPVYNFEPDDIPKKYRNHKKITFKNLVEPLYKREDENKFKETINQFANKKDLIVIIPDPERICKELNIVCWEFCKKIKDNEHFKQILKETSVLDNYRY